MQISVSAFTKLLSASTRYIEEGHPVTCPMESTSHVASAFTSEKYDIPM
jgi:hypothetical protein